MHLHHEGSMIRVHCQLMICRGHIRASKGALKILVKFFTLFSFWLQFQWVINQLGGQKSSLHSISIWSNGIQCKNRKKKFLRITGALFA